jgi:hypothetical protein
MQWYMSIIPATQEAEIVGGLWFKARLDKKVSKTCNLSKVGMVACAYNSSYMGGKYWREDCGLRLALDKNMRPYLKSN